MKAFTALIFGTVLAVSASAFAADLTVVNSLTFAEHGNYIVLADDQGIGRIVCIGSWMHGSTLYISLSRGSSKSFSLNGAISLAKSFSSETECLNAKNELMSATPEHPMHLVFSAATKDFEIQN